MRTANLAAALLTIASTAAAQDYVTRACSEGRVVADLGYSGTTCGNCILDAGYIQYLTEPSISQIRSGGPADGRLRENDVLVAVDGALITTRQGWRRMYDLRPEETVTLTVRRNGVERDVSITPASRCDPNARRSRLADRDENSSDDAVQASSRDRDRDRDADRDRVRTRDQQPRYNYLDSVSSITRQRMDDIRARLAGQSERIRDQVARAMERSMSRNFASSDNADSATTRRGWLGVAIECSECGAVSVGRGDYRWGFREEPRITSVVPGGPAARAGLHSGDVVVEIDGRSITSPEGGRRWGSIHPGDEIELQVRRGNARRGVTVEADSAPRARAVAVRPQVQAFNSRFWRGLPVQQEAQQPTIFSRSFAGRDSTTHYEIDGASVDIDGKASDVRFDRETGEIVIVGPDFTVRIKSKNPR